MINVRDLMAVPDGGDELPEIFAYLWLCQSSFVDLLLEVAALNVLLDQKLLVVIGVVYYFEEFDDVGMTHFLHDGPFFF